jgi:hypothetical protein
VPVASAVAGHVRARRGGRSRACLCYRGGLWWRMEAWVEVFAALTDVEAGDGAGTALGEGGGSSLRRTTGRAPEPAERLTRGSG